jgi:hypothetical protein
VSSFYDRGHVNRIILFFRHCTSISPKIYAIRIEKLVRHELVCLQLKGKHKGLKDKKPQNENNASTADGKNADRTDRPHFPCPAYYTYSDDQSSPALCLSARPTGAAPSGGFPSSGPVSGGDSWRRRYRLKRPEGRRLREPRSRIRAGNELLSPFEGQENRSPSCSRWASSGVIALLAACMVSIFQFPVAGTALIRACVPFPGHPFPASGFPGGYSCVPNLKGMPLHRILQNPPLLEPAGSKGIFTQR